MSPVQHSEIPSQNKTGTIREYTKSRTAKKKQHYESLSPAAIKSYREDAVTTTVGARRKLDSEESSEMAAPPTTGSCTRQGEVHTARKCFSINNTAQLEIHKVTLLPKIPPPTINTNQFSKTSDLNVKDKKEKRQTQQSTFMTTEQAKCCLCRACSQ